MTTEGRLQQLTTQAAHSEARAEWEQFFVESVRHLGLKSTWVDWLNTSYQTCMPHDDSFTILSKKRSDRPLGFSFDLHLSEPTSPVIHSYWRVFGEGMLEEPIQHFVITVEATPGGYECGRAQLLGWMKANDQKA